MAGEVDDGVDFQHVLHPLFAQTKQIPADDRASSDRILALFISVARSSKYITLHSPRRRADGQTASASSLVSSVSLANNAAVKSSLRFGDDLSGLADPQAGGDREVVEKVPLW
jgi:hypothetical protein